MYSIPQQDVAKGRGQSELARAIPITLSYAVKKYPSPVTPGGGCTIFTFSDITSSFHFLYSHSGPSSPERVLCTMLANPFGALNPQFLFRIPKSAFAIYSALSIRNSTLHSLPLKGSLLNHIIKSHHQQSHKQYHLPQAIHSQLTEINRPGLHKNHFHIEQHKQNSY